MEFRVDVTAKVGEAARDEGLGSRLLAALEEAGVFASVASQNTEAGTLDAVLYLQAEDAYGAVTMARDFFQRALVRVGFAGAAELLELHVTEAEPEEEAAAIG